MASYETTTTIRVKGKPHRTLVFDHPDEACLLECQEEFEKFRKEALTYRKAHPHDKALAVPNHETTVVSVSIVTTRDGKPHMEETGAIHDLPSPALGEFETAISKFLAVPCVASVLRPL